MIPLDRIISVLGPESPISDHALAQLESFAALVRKWNPSINMIAKSTVDDLWERHIVDSLQVFRCASPKHRLWLDLGSGGGFPGIVVAILAAELLPELRVVLVESDKRKCVFLSEASRQLGVSVSVVTKRIEDIEPQRADIVSARALSPLTVLCGYAHRHLAPDGVCAFLKGANFGAEIEEASRRWQFDYNCVESITDARSAVLFLRGLRHV